MTQCKATLKFEEGKAVICELEEGHAGNHRALVFEWTEYNQQSDDSIWFKGYNLLKSRMKK